MDIQIIDADDRFAIQSRWLVHHAELIRKVASMIEITVASYCCGCKLACLSAGESLRFPFFSCESVDALRRFACSLVAHQYSELFSTVYESITTIMSIVVSQEQKYPGLLSDAWDLYVIRSITEN